MNAFDEKELVFLIADLSGYTALTEAHGNVSAARIVGRYGEIVNRVIQPGARLVDRVGDEVLIVADDPVTSLSMALKLCEMVERESLFPDIHAGIHSGTVVEKDGRYFGAALNVASRVAAHARGGQILCTGEIVKMTADDKKADYRSVGPVRFKNVKDPIEIFEVVRSSPTGEARSMDLVCRMKISHDEAPAKLPFGGKTYYFCSFECAKRFAATPGFYVGDQTVS